ncbi:hypothetical protein [Candidatus Stoquefichus massiliensis]|uniref:hypothetical protein n=1 Tax=Candidatus Stoquefichus massiliensis TaxID=1470350 RepID=UPI0004818B53|nr:hypothetical protein [Candidatus Stoquefichus massiliensis]
MEMYFLIKETKQDETVEYRGIYNTERNVQKRFLEITKDISIKEWDERFKIIVFTNVGEDIEEYENGFEFIPSQLHWYCLGKED